MDPMTAAVGAKIAGASIKIGIEVVNGAIKALYGITKSVNDFLDEHIQEMQDSENLTISRTGNILMAAKCGFGIGYITSVAIITTGQLLLGNPLGAAATVVTAGTLTNPVAMTCAAVGAIFYGWNALSDQERNEILVKLSKWLEVGRELIKAIIQFVIGKAKELLQSENLSEIKVFIRSSAEMFGKSLGDITHKIVDVLNDGTIAVKKKTGEIVHRTVDTASEAIDTVKEAAEKMSDGAKGIIDKVTHKKEAGKDD